jgi:hypothetical protein
MGVGRAEGSGRKLFGPGLTLIDGAGTGRDCAVAGIDAEPRVGPIDMTGLAKGGADKAVGLSEGGPGGVSAGGGRLREEDSTSEASAEARSPRSLRFGRSRSGRSGTWFLGGPPRAFSLRRRITRSSAAAASGANESTSPIALSATSASP